MSKRKLPYKGTFTCNSWEEFHVASSFNVITVVNVISLYFIDKRKKNARKARSIRKLFFFVNVLSLWRFMFFLDIFELVPSFFMYLTKRKKLKFFEKLSLFYWKSSFCSQNTQIFVLSFPLLFLVNQSWMYNRSLLKINPMFMTSWWYLNRNLKK